VAHRVYRLSIAPEAHPEIRRVVDLDGRSSLGALHGLIVQSFELPVTDELYGFSLNGRFDDAKTIYVGPGAEGQRAERALLFRLGLKPGKRFHYLLGARAARRFVLEVLAISEVPQPQAFASLVESSGSAARVQRDPSSVAELVPLAEAFLSAHDLLEPFAEQLTELRAQLEPWEHEGSQLEDPSATPARRGPRSVPVPEEVLPLLADAAMAALTLLQVMGGDARRFLRLDQRLSERSLGQRLLDLPLDLSAVGQHERALEVAEALAFVDPELVRGDSAIILARAGRRDDALALLDESLSRARDKSFVEAKAGDVHRVLGDSAAAEAYYRRSLSEAANEFDRSQAVLRLVTCLIESDRAAEASQLLASERARPKA
jgi:tetratricopeptide (TPR) repeat protein